MAQKLDTGFLDQNSSCVVIGDSLLVPRILFEPSFDYVTYLMIYFGKKLPARFWGTCCVFFKSKEPLPFGASVATIWLHGVIPKVVLRAHRFVNSCSRLGFGMNISTWRRCPSRC